MTTNYEDNNEKLNISTTEKLYIHFDAKLSVFECILKI